MSDTSVANTGPRSLPDPDGRSGRLIPYGVAVLATLLAAGAWLFPSPALAGVLVLVVAASSFGMAARLTREEHARAESESSQKQLSRDAARVQAFFRYVRDGVHIVGTDGHLVDVSDSFCRMLGYTRGEMIGMHVSQWDAKRNADQLEGFLVELFANPETITFETLHRRKDGSVFDVEVHGCPIDMNGQRVLFHSSRDISDRKLLKKHYRDIYQTILSVKKEA